jgi:hypothetical protein
LLLGEVVLPETRPAPPFPAQPDGPVGQEAHRVFSAPNFGPAILVPEGSALSPADAQPVGDTVDVIEPARDQVDL